MDESVVRQSDEGPLESADYERSRCRHALFRVLANNIVRQLQDSGYTGHELLGFAGEVMRAITENGWTDQPAVDPLASGAEPPAERDHLGRYRPEIPHNPDARTFLRPPEELDRPALERWEEDPVVAVSLAPILLRQVRENLVEPSLRCDRVVFMICDDASRQPFGLVALSNIDRVAGQAELGKIIGEPSWRGKGIAAKATAAIVDYGFGTLGLRRLYLRTLGGNLKNIKLNERMGFRFEGALKEAAMVDGRVVDIVLMAMLRSERSDTQPPSTPG